MDKIYKAYVDEFLSKKHIIIAGYSSKKDTPAHTIYKKFKDNGYQVYALNPKAKDVTDVICYSSFSDLPVKAEAVFICTPSQASAAVVEDAANASIKIAWIHQSIGTGSFSEAAVRKAREYGIKLIPSGCPMMFLKPDIFHKCLPFFLKKKLMIDR